MFSMVFKKCGVLLIWNQIAFYHHVLLLELESIHWWWEREGCVCFPHMIIFTSQTSRVLLIERTKQKREKSEVALDSKENQVQC